MKYFKISLLILYIILSKTLNAQSKKDIRNNKIQTSTSIITTFDNGNEVSYKDNYTVYDKNGNIIEETEYFSNGTIKLKKSYKYNSDKNKTEETEYDGKTKNTIKTIFSYNSNGYKISEVVYDGNGKFLRKSIFLYDKNGIRTERKTFDKNNKLISVKKYIYTKK